MSPVRAADSTVLAAPTPEVLRAQAARCRDILRRSLIEFYLPACLDPINGGYKETFRNEQFVLTGENFLTLQARQLWFFSTLVSEKIEAEKSLAAAKHGFEFLQARFLDPLHGGYYSKVTDNGEIKDPRKHAYLNSFALYSLCAYYQASGDSAALDAAKALFKILELKAHDATNGGYIEFFHRDWSEIKDPKEPRYVGAIGHKTYNTHLHLMEALAELYRVWPDEAVRGRLQELIIVNTSTVRHPRVDSNVDAYTADWTVVNEPGNLRASYGHDVECAWLVLDAARALKMPERLYSNWAESLCQTSLQFGYDAPLGGFYSSGPLGQPANDRQKVWWVQAEALVAMVDMFRITGNSKYYQAFAGTLDFVEKYQVAKTGGWWANRQADGSAAGQERSNAWQGAYHAGRAMLWSAKRLEALAAGRR